MLHLGEERSQWYKLVLTWRNNFPSAQEVQSNSQYMWNFNAELFLLCEKIKLIDKRWTKLEQSFTLFGNSHSEVSLLSSCYCRVLWVIKGVMTLNTIFFPWNQFLLRRIRNPDAALSTAQNTSSEENSIGIQKHPIQPSDLNWIWVSPIPKGACTAQPFVECTDSCTRNGMTENVLWVVY